MTAYRLPLVGRLHSLRLTATDVAFRLRVSFKLQGDIDYHCHSRRPDVLQAAAALHDGQLIGVVGVAPSRTAARCGFIVERLELLGRATREAVA